jgi:uncharacterized protein YdaT
MPWTAKTFKAHNKKLTPAKAKQAAKGANAILERTGDEGLAIATANKQAKHGKKETPMQKYINKRKKK